MYCSRLEELQKAKDRKDILGAKIERWEYAGDRARYTRWRD
jgi:hypothetical protein